MEISSNSYNFASNQHLQIIYNIWLKFLALICMFFKNLKACPYILNLFFNAQMGNKGAFIRFEAPDMKPNIATFTAVVSSFSPSCAFTTKLGNWKKITKFSLQILNVLVDNNSFLHFLLIAATSWCQTNGVCEQLPTNVLVIH